MNGMGRQKKPKPSEHLPFEAKSKLVYVGSRDGYKYRYTDKNGNEQTDTDARIAYTLMVSTAFKSLTPRQRVLYLCAKSEFYAARSRPSKDFRDENGEPLEIFREYGGKGCIYLNRKLLCDVYGLYPPSNKRDLYADIQALIQAGLLERVTGLERFDITKTNHQRNIFRFSEKWKETE